MEIISQKGSEFIVKFEKGENYPAALVRFLKKRKIRSGFFYGLGGFVDPEIAYYDLKIKKYFSRQFRGVFEVLSLVGNVATLGKKIVVHNHVILGKRNYQVIGGHLNKAKVGGTLEIYFHQLDNKLKRSYDKKTGLNLLK